MKKVKDLERLKLCIKEVNAAHIFKPHAIKHLELRYYESGEIIYLAQDSCEYLHIIVSGKVKIFLLTNLGKFMFLDVSVPLDFIGDAEFIQNKKLCHNVEALTECLLISIPTRKIYDITIQSELYYFLSRNISDKLLKTSKRFSLATIYPIKNRLVTHLVKISDKNRINNFKTKEIADRLGVTPRHMRRILGELYAENIIEKQGQTIHISNIKALHKYIIKD